MYARILVPLDGSPLSQLALPYAQMLAQACNAGVELVFGIETKDVPENVASEIRKDGEDYLKQIAASLPDSLKPKFTVQAGHPPEVILERSSHVMDGGAVREMPDPDALEGNRLVNRVVNSYLEAR